MWYPWDFDSLLGDTLHTLLSPSQPRPRWTSGVRRGPRVPYARFAALDHQNLPIPDIPDIENADYPEKLQFRVVSFHLSAELCLYHLREQAHLPDRCELPAHAN